MELVTILYIISLILIIVFELIRKKNSKADILTVVNIWFSITYLVVPIITINDSFYINNHFLKAIPSNGVEYFFAYIYILLFYITLIFSYNYRKNKTGFIKLKQVKKISWDKFSIVLIMISIIGLALFIFGYGGVRSVISNANLIRNGRFERNTFAAIARMFTSYAVVALLITYYIYRTSKDIKTKTKSSILFVCASGITLFSAVLSGGRGGLLTPIILLYLTHVIISNKWKVGKLILITPIVLFVLLYGKVFFSNMENGIDYLIQYIVSDISSTRFVLKDFIENFTHPYYSLLNIMQSTSEGNGFLLLFRNVFFTFGFFGYLFGLPYQGTISHYNTELILGYFDSVIPPGIIALGFYNLPIAGIILVGIMFGYLLGIIESTFSQMEKSSSNIALYLIVSDSMAKFIFNGDIRVFILQNFSLIILLVVVSFMYFKLSKKKKLILKH